MPKPKTIAVIGSNSFSGADFIDLVLHQRDYQVIGVSRSQESLDLFLPYQQNPHRDRMRFFQIDLNHQFGRLKSVFEDLQPAYVVNFAALSEVAPSWLHPEHWFETNAVAVTKLTNFLKDCSWLERYLHISTPEVYGTCQGEVREDCLINPSTPYAASKAAGDLMITTLQKQFQFPSVTIRATNVYGPHQQLYKIIPRANIYLALDKTIELHGGGQAIKSYIHIRDVSLGELLALERGKQGQLYHLSPDAGTISIRELVQIICEINQKDFSKVTRVIDERPGQDKAYVINSDKARAELGWQPTHSLQTGLVQVKDWIWANLEQIRGLELEYIHRA